MASVSSNKDFVSITCGVKTFLVPYSNSELFSVDHCDLKDVSISVDKQNSVSGICRSDIVSDEVGIGLMCSDLSSQGNLLAFCTINKLLCVADTKPSGVLVKSVYCLARGASKVKFTPSGKSVVVADKSGDVYLFDLEKSDQGQLILGHLSMLLDVLVTPDENFIITCDRDEKIRVSSFPNGYNIVAYCLGHSEFVSSILLFPSNNSYLISASGDGSVRFWDYKIGKEVAICNTSSYFENDNVDFDTRPMAITDAASVAIDSSSSLLCVTIECINVCLVIKCSFVGNTFSFVLNQRLSLDDSSPWRLTLNSDILWMVLDVKDRVFLKAFKFSRDSNIFNDSLPEDIMKAVSVLNNQVMSANFKNIVNLLFKRKFDNVQEYLNKKEARMLSESSNKRVKH